MAIKKWREKDSVEDGSSRSHKLRASLTQEQEDLILFERKKFKKKVEETFSLLNSLLKESSPISTLLKFTGAWYGFKILPVQNKLHWTNGMVKRFNQKVKTKVFKK